MSRSSAPYGMLLDRGLTLEQLDLAYDIAVADPDPKTNRKRLTIALRDIVSEQEAEGKTKKCLTRVWLNPPPVAAEMIRWALQLNASTDRVVLHFGALLATFPFVGSVARILGQHLRTEGQVEAGALRAEVRRTLGDRPSVDVSARKAYTAFRHLGIINQTEQLLTPVATPVTVPEELTGWLAHAVMLTRHAESIVASSVSSAPELLGVVESYVPQHSYSLLEAHTEADGLVLVQRHPLPPLELVELEPCDSRISQVLALWRTQRKWLGFLPNQGFTDRAAKGTLLAAVTGGTVVGYILYDLPGDRIKLIHLCVSEGHRGQGIAGRLVDAVSARHGARRGIDLKCRRDYPANEIWPQLGFVARQEVPGRNDAGLPLTYWHRDHGHPDLFTYDPGSDPNNRLAVAVDHNIVIDLLKTRDEGAESTHLEDPWIGEYITLCITDEVDQEIDRCDDATERERMRAGLTRFRRISTPVKSDGSGGTWEDFVPVIEEAAPDADPPDHRHIARAVSGGASYFVSRDGRLNEAAEQVSAAAHIEVMRPEALISHVDRLRSQERYEPTVLHSTSFAVDPAAGHESAFVATFLNYGAGERKAQLQPVLRAALADPANHESFVVMDEAGQLLGGLIRKRGDTTLDVQAIRVRGTDRTSYAVARQLAYLQRELAATTKAAQVVVSDPYPSVAVRYALALEGFRAECNRWACDVTPGIQSISEIDPNELATDTAPMASAAILEHDRWPLKVTDAGIPTFVVPIRPHWAEQLFDSTLAAGTLFGRDGGLGLSREHVYYRKPRNANGIRPPARILWYVSGRSAGQSQGSIRAVSQLAEVVVDRPLAVYQRFARLGIYSEDQVRASANDQGMVMALRFVDTELLAKPVGLSEIRSLFDSEGATFVAPMSPRQIDEQWFVQLYKESSIHAS